MHISFPHHATRHIHLKGFPTARLLEFAEYVLNRKRKSVICRTSNNISLTVTTTPTPLINKLTELNVSTAILSSPTNPRKKWKEFR
jgi:hypothetical protein